VFAAPAAVPMVKDGRVRAIAATTPKRIPALPAVPTVAEAGLPAAEHIAWFAMFAPAGTPKAIVNKLAGDLNMSEDVKRCSDGQRDGQTKNGAGGHPAPFSSLIGLLLFVSRQSSLLGYADLRDELGVLGDLGPDERAEFLRCAGRSVHAKGGKGLLHLG